VIEHGADGADGEAGAERLLHVDQQDAHAVRGVRLLAPTRAAEQQHEIRMLGARNPDFAAADDIIVAVPLGEGRYARSICARVGLGDAEGLQAQFAAGDARQIFRLLRVAAVPQQRAHRVHLGVAGRAIAARTMHLVENRHGGA
jgi:hypothetical protein